MVSSKVPKSVRASIPFTSKNSQIEEIQKKFTRLRESQKEKASLNNTEVEIFKSLETENQLDAFMEDDIDRDIDFEMMRRVL